MSMDKLGPKMGSNRDESVTVQKDAWEKPEIVSYAPAKNAEGISYRPLDGISNLT